MNAGKSFDYVIVGAGSAGCVLTNRLSEDPATTVLVIEAGGPDRDPWIQIPLGWGKILTERRHDWMYFTEPEPNCDIPGDSASKETIPTNRKRKREKKDG